MATANPDNEAPPPSMFMQRTSPNKSPVRSEPSSRRNSTVKTNIPQSPVETITVKDFFDFMKTAYQVYEHLEGDEEEGSKIDWEELTKLTVLNHVIEQQERNLLHQTTFADPKPIISKSDTAIEREKPCEKTEKVEKRYSCTELELKVKGRRRSLPPEAKVEMLGVWTEANLNCKLNDVINEGILDSILPYLVGYKKPSKTTSVYTPIIKKTSSNAAGNEIKKPASFGGFINEKESRDRLGRRKSSVIAAQERLNQKQDGDVEIHVCDEVKGLKKDFRCSQKLLVSKMGYFADVTAGQRLEDMDISVHCDIQIFEWLMRWVKRDSILVADWPLLEPSTVVPILVSASFLQMEPLLHDCLIYCHAHVNDIVKTSTNLACLSDALLTRLAAMYTNVELEAIRDRKDKIQSRLYCKMILSLAEPVPETLRGHYATLATLFKCSKCNKLLGRHIAEQVPCQPASMRIDRRGNVISTHAKDTSWNLNEYIRWLHSQLGSWRRVYWRLWAEAHFLHCHLCSTYFPAYQMEWCSHHEQGPQMFGIEGRPPLPAGRYPCCGERAYRFETVTRNTGCQFRSHVASDETAADAAVLEICAQFRDLIAMNPPELVFPERLTRLRAREPTEETTGRLHCKEVFWWEGIQLLPPRQPLGLLGKLYTSNNKFNPLARPGSPPLTVVKPSAASVAAIVSSTGICADKDLVLVVPTAKVDSSPRKKIGASPKPVTLEDGEEESTDSSDTDDGSEGSDASDGSEEDAPPRSTVRRAVLKRVTVSAKKRVRVVGRQWISSLSARSNQDGQRRFEERAARQMRVALARRAALATPARAAPPGRLPSDPRRTRVNLSGVASSYSDEIPIPQEIGGVYAKLEADWRERHCQLRPRNAVSARPRQAIKYK